MTFPLSSSPLPTTAASVAPGCGLKVACVSAAVSDESVAGDSGVYEASVQRWVHRRRSVPGGGGSVGSGCSSPCSTECGRAPVTSGAMPNIKTARCRWCPRLPQQMWVLGDNCQMYTIELDATERESILEWAPKHEGKRGSRETLGTQPAASHQEP